MDKKTQTLLKCKENLKYIKGTIQNESLITEYKCKVGEPELGTSSACYQSTLHSSSNGVPILEGEGSPRQMVRFMKKKLRISSWIDNI